MKVSFLQKRKDSVARELVEWVADAEWTIVVSKKGDEVSVGYFDVTDETQIIGALHHAIFKMHRKLEGQDPDV